LRIDCGDNILDNTAVHPESYDKAETLLKLFSYTKEDVRARRIADLKQKINAYGAQKAANEKFQEINNAYEQIKKERNLV
jgi:uncharacterized protein